MTAQQSEAPSQTTTQFVVFTIIAEIVAAAAAFGSLSLSLAPWAMFVG